MAPPNRSMEPVNVGVVGGGVMGQLVHLPILAGLPQCNVVAIADLRPELGKLVAEKFGIPKVYRSHLELAADDAVEAIVEVTADDLHAPITIDLLNAGKHVLVEKPLTTNVRDGEAILKASEATNATLMVNYMRRYDPGIELASRVISELKSSGEIGEIVAVRSHHFGNDWFSDIGRPITTDEPYPDLEKTAPDWLPENMVNAFRHANNVYSHNLDLLRALLGDVVEVEFAQIGVPTELQRDPTFGLGRTNPPSGPAKAPSSEMQFTVVMRFDNFPATLTCGARSGHFWDDETVVYFADGWVRINNPPTLLRNVPAQVEICRADGKRELPRPDSPWGWSFARAEEHFLECVRDQQTPRTSGAEALESLRLVEAIFAKSLQRV